MGYTYDIHPPVFLILFSLILIINSFIVKVVKKKSFILKDFIFSSMFIFYILSVIKLTIFPFKVLNEGYDLSKYSYLYYQLEPFHTIKRALELGNIIQISGNLLLLFPLTIVWQLKKQKSISFFKATLIIIYTSASIELIQYFINILAKVPNGVADIDDLILNTVGGLLGYFVFEMLKKISVMKKIISD